MSFHEEGRYRPLINFPEDVLETRLAPIPDWAPGPSDEHWLREVETPVSTSEATSGVESATAQAFASWAILDGRRRTQYFRECEIADFIRAQFGSLPRVVETSVARGGWRGRQVLVGVVSIDRTGHADELAQLVSSIPQAAVVESRIPNVLRTVPMRVEFVLDRRLGSDRSGTATSVVRDGGAGAAIARSGDHILGRNPVGFTKSGTLGIFGFDDGGEHRLLSSAHVLGGPGCHVLSQSWIAHLGEVQAACEVLDVAIASVDESVTIDAAIRELGLVPSAPILPTLDQPVQFVGAQSGHQKGRISRTQRLRAGHWGIGESGSFEIDSPAREGDSGALIVSGIGFETGYADEYVRLMEPGYSASMVGAMVGILKAGGVDQVTGNHEILGVPALSALTRFGLKPVCQLLLEDDAA